MRAALAQALFIEPDIMLLVGAVPYLMPQPFLQSLLSYH